MKQYFLHALVVAAALAGLWLTTGCSVTPHANLGVGVNFYNGSFHLNPHANIGVYGRP